MSIVPTRLPVTIRRLNGFDDPACARDTWNRLLSHGDSDCVYLTWEWQRSWWTALGRGELLLMAAERGDGIVAVAPWYVDEGMVFFVGSGNSGYLDFIGDLADLDRKSVV